MVEHAKIDSITFFYISVSHSFPAAFVRTMTFQILTISTLYSVEMVVAKLGATWGLLRPVSPHSDHEQQRTYRVIQTPDPFPSQSKIIIAYENICLKRFWYLFGHPVTHFCSKKKLGYLGLLFP